MIPETPGLHHAGCRARVFSGLRVGYRSQSCFQHLFYDQALSMMGAVGSAAPIQATTVNLQVCAGWGLPAKLS